MQNLSFLLVFCLAIVSVSGCAPAPAKIMAEPVSKLPYLELTCEELGTELELALPSHGESYYTSWGILILHKSGAKTQVVTPCLEVIVLLG